MNYSDIKFLEYLESFSGSSGIKYPLSNSTIYSPAFPIDEE